MTQIHPLVRAWTWLFAALFALSALVQLNDPDWLPWFAFYVAATLVAGMAPVWVQARRAALLIGLVALIWAVGIAAPGLEPITLHELTTDLRMKTLNVERWREIGGLAIVVAWSLGVVPGLAGRPLAP